MSSWMSIPSLDEARSRIDALRTRELLEGRPPVNFMATLQELLDTMGSDAAARMPTLDEARYRVDALLAGDPVSGRGPGMRALTPGVSDYLEGSLDAITPIPVAALATKTPAFYRDLASEFMREYGVDPTLKSARALQNYGEALQKPGFRRRETLSQSGTIAPIIERAERSPAPRLELTSDQVLVPLRADISSRGDVIRQVGGVDIPDNFTTEGGPDFARDYAGTGIGWASMVDAAQNKQANVDLAFKETGLEPIMVYSSMGPWSTKFSTMPTELAMAQMPSLKISKAAREAFDKDVRSVKEGKRFVGLGHKDVLDQLLGRGDYPMEGAGTLRNAFIDSMKKMQFQYAGFPDTELIRRAIIHPELTDAAPNVSGLAAIRGIPGASLRPDVAHRSYSHGIPGEYVGTLGSHPLESVFPDIMREIGSKPSAAMQRSLLMARLMQPVTDEVLRNLGY